MRTMMRLNDKGMTLPEIMVSATYAVFMTASIYAFASFFANAKYEYQANVEASNLARKAMDQIVWGARDPGEVERHGIAEAVTGTIDSATQFTYTDTGGETHVLRLNAGNIEYQRNAGAWRTLLDPNGTSVAYNPATVSTSLQFLAGANPNSVDVRIVVGRKILSKWYYGSAETNVFYRNT